jgi:competence protein ComEA
MKTLSKFLALAISSMLLLTAASTAIADPSEEMRSLVVTADYHPVNVNESSASEIAAAAIVAYRKANGPFKTTQSLTAVKGIGAKTLLKNERVILLE